MCAFSQGWVLDVVCGWEIERDDAEAKKETSTADAGTTDCSSEIGLHEPYFFMGIIWGNSAFRFGQLSFNNITKGCV